MGLTIKRPKGTYDILPSQVNKWHTIEKVTSNAAKLFGFKEIRVPTFEDTGLFVRSVGETTDVVQKEMYSVSASGDASFTLRPEGTAGVMRAIIENGMLNDGFPQRVYYNLSCFRHENVQKGRLREFHQFGCEMVGAASPKADADIICLAKKVLDDLGLSNIRLMINTIGCPDCRGEYQKALKEYFDKRRDVLCDTCRERLEKNPMRILDCKSPACQYVVDAAPKPAEYVCNDCADHFMRLEGYLRKRKIEFTLNPRLVRGLDYYTKTVFEFVSDEIGAQGTVCGGGRYDGLIEQLGAKPTPALGFGMGIERLLLVMQQQGCKFDEPHGCDLYLASLGEAAEDEVVVLAEKLRKEGYYVDYDLVDRGLKAQMKYADKIKAKFVLVVGDDELERGWGKLRNMQTGELIDMPLDERFLIDAGDALTSEEFKGKDLTIEDNGLGFLGL